MLLVQQSKKLIDLHEVEFYIHRWHLCWQIISSLKGLLYLRIKYMKCEMSPARGIQNMKLFNLENRLCQIENDSKKMNFDKIRQRS